MFKHHEKGENISLHDCTIDRIKFKDGWLSLYFGDGFWIDPNHPENDTGMTLKTDAAKVKFHLVFEDKCDFSVYVLSRKGDYKKRLCTEPKKKKFFERVNSGNCTLEVLWIYETKYNSLKIIECVIWDKKHPHSDKCFIKLDSDKVKYCWNELTETEY